MNSLCDGCDGIFDVKLTRVNAKEWKPSLCKVPLKKSETCCNIDCDYNLEAECCMEYQFCQDCVSNNQTVDAIFMELYEDWL